MDKLDLLAEFSLNTEPGKASPQLLHLALKLISESMTIKDKLQADSAKKTGENVALKLHDKGIDLKVIAYCTEIPMDQLESLVRSKLS